MFSGIGGFELGIEQAYEAKNSGVVSQRGQVDSVSGRQEAKHGARMGDTSARLSDNGTNESSPICVGYSEIDKYACQIYEKHFTKRLPYCSDCWGQESPERKLFAKGEGVRCESGESCINCGKSASLLFSFGHTNYGDCTTINASELPDFDLLVGGFPCQAFSIAGKRGGLDDARGTLFYDIARIAKEKRPQHLLLENVKGLLSHDNGRTFKLIISTFAELGYNLEWQVLNSKNFGVPQNRERVFIIGHLGRCCGRQVFPLGENTGADNEQTELRTGRQLLQGDELRTVQEKEAQTISEPSGQIIRKEWDSTDNSDSRGGQTHSNDYRIRRLTPIECERLQGFPGGWTEGVSDTQRYKCLGNAVTVNVIKEIITRLYENLLGLR